VFKFELNISEFRLINRSILDSVREIADHCIAAVLHWKSVVLEISKPPSKQKGPGFLRALFEIRNEDLLLANSLSNDD